MVSQWPQLIVKIVRLQQEYRRVEPLKIYEFEYPGVGANPAQLERLQQVRGRLPASYLEFLSKANGWRSVYQWVDLFSVEDLLDGPYDEAVSILNTLGDAGALGSVLPAHLLPIALTRAGHRDLGPDVFALTVSGEDVGRVRWFAGELVEDFENFEEFFLAVVEFNRRGLLKAVQRNAS